ncbi:glycosyltransferase family 8 protein [Fontimonas sp. SYSU GA230001]|uniref:glycosyltransferase family 8 protein n=1 Tax=Fontimonas sp. SYSU GA230001 TaxID=3142450 RepID=UPI0032B44B94
MIHVACAADETYVPHAAAMIHSLLRAPGGEAVTVHFLHAAALAPALIAQLDAFVTGLDGRLRCHAIADARVAGLPTMGRISRVMWFRVFLPELLPDVPRVLYLDCDTIVVRDLRPLFALDLEGACLGAVSNVFEPHMAQHARTLGLEDPRAYFNSGVLLLDLDAWRRADVAHRVLELARDPARRLVWPDQDALNIALAGRWKALHPRWNCQNSLYFFRHAPEVFGANQVAEATADPGILHFEGGDLAKPWHYLCKHPARRLYLRHRAATPWPLRQLDGRTLVHRLLHPLPIGLLIPTLRLLHRAAGVRRRLRRALSP